MLQMLPAQRPSERTPLCIAVVLAIVLLLTALPASLGNAQVAPAIVSLNPKSGPSTSNPAGGVHVAIEGVRGSIPPITAVHFGDVPAPWFKWHNADQVIVRTPAGLTGPVPVTVTDQEGVISNALVFTFQEPSSGSWSRTLGELHSTDMRTATPLRDGRVLMTGMEGTEGKIVTEIYDPVTKRFFPAPPRKLKAAITALKNGLVLGTGADPDRPGGSRAEIFDPAAGGEWALRSHTSTLPPKERAILLDPPFCKTQTGASGAYPCGKVLLVGGRGPSDQAERATLLYDPEHGFSAAGSLKFARGAFVSALLPDGRVLAAGGVGRDLVSGMRYWDYPLASAEIYDPVTQAWTETGSMAIPRTDASGALLESGTVLVAGGNANVQLTERHTSAEIYFPQTIDPTSGLLGTWRATGLMNAGRSHHSSALLPDGSVLVVGGIGNNFASIPRDSAEIYDPASGLWRYAPVPMTPRAEGSIATPLSTGEILVAGGNAYDPESAGAGGTTAGDLFNPPISTPPPAQPPEITSVDPNQGPAQGGTRVVVGGNRFTGATSVVFGTQPQSSVPCPGPRCAVESDARIVISRNPPHDPGVVDVRVETSAGISPITPADRFTYTSPGPPDNEGDPPAEGGGDSSGTTAVALPQPVPPPGPGSGTSPGGFGPAASVPSGPGPPAGASAPALVPGQATAPIPAFDPTAVGAAGPNAAVTVSPPEMSGSQVAAAQVPAPEERRPSPQFNMTRRSAGGIDAALVLPSATMVLLGVCVGTFTKRRMQAGSCCQVPAPALAA